MSEGEAVETELAPDRAAELIAAGAQLVDVRRSYEWEGGRIAGARHLEMNDLSAAAGSIARERPVVFYCRAGDRSGMAAEAFREAGWDAHNLSGGILAWVEAGHPLAPEAGEVRAPLPAS